MEFEIAEEKTVLVNRMRGPSEIPEATPLCRAKNTPERMKQTPVLLCSQLSTWFSLTADMGKSLQTLSHR